MSPELRAELERAADSAPLTGRDLAPAAWTAARSAARRHRLVAAASVVVLAGTGWAVSTRLDQPPATRPAVTPTQTAIDVLPDSIKGGFQIEYAVPPAQQAALAPLPADLNPELPARIGFDASASIRRISGVGPVNTTAVAVLLRRVSGGYHPVVLLSRGPGQPLDDAARYLELDSVLLRPFGVDTPDPYVALGPRVIAPDGHRLAFVQPGEVVGIDLRVGTVVRTPLPVSDAAAGGWTSGGRWFLAWSASGQWRLDPLAQVVQPVAETVYDGAGRIHPVSSGSGANLVTFGADGAALDQRELPPWLGDTSGDTVTSGAGWSATGTFLSADAQAELSGAWQGLVAAPVSGMPRLLVAAADGPVKGCCTALGWAAPTVVLYSSAVAGPSSPTGPVTRRLLAWVVTSGRQWFVADLPSGMLPNGDADERVGAALPLVSLAQRP